MGGTALTLQIGSEPVPVMVDESGAARVGDTRVTLDTLVAVYLRGATPDEIASRYPTLDRVDIYATIAYYLRHQQEVEDYLRQREEEASRVRAGNEENFPPEGIRERLLERRPGNYL